MITDIEKAKRVLNTGEYTCVLYRGDSVFTSTQRGVKPLVVWLESGDNFVGFSAADKVVGRATAFLYALLGVKEVYAGVISKPALSVFESYNIIATYGTLAENIINRQGDGICPFESAVLDTTDPNTAYKKIRQKMAEMNISL